MPSTKGEMYLGDILVSGGGGNSGPYERPADWLPLPAVSPGDQKFVGLMAVHNSSSNFAALRFAGAYTVDWGDGTAPQNVATGVAATHAYAWASVPANTLTSRGYRQAIVTVTPQAGQNFTSMNLQLGTVFHPSQRTGQTSKWLDIKLAGPNLTSIPIGGSATTAHRLLEQFEWVGSAPASLTSGNQLFYNCSSLMSLIGGANLTANMTAIGTAFRGCTSLAVGPDLDTSKVTDCASLFYGCTNLKYVPDYDTSKVTNFNTCFQDCLALVVAPAFNLASATTTSAVAMFGNCTSMERIRAVGSKYGMDISSCNLGATELNEFYSNLGTASGAQTITVTGNWGTASDTPSIASAKGFTVTGS